MKTDMEQRDQNRDSTDTEPKYQRQSRKESNSEIVVEEQESGKQKEVQHRGRGKYNQYEAAEVIIEKIRSYRTQRYPDSEIMKFLDNMPRRTYYNYVKKLQEQDGQIMEQWMAENVEHISEEMMIYRETLCQKLERFKQSLIIKILQQKTKCKQ